MRKERLEAAKRIADRLLETETAIDLAIARASELTASMPLARQDANLSAIVGQDAMESAAKIVPALAKARQSIVATHRQLDEAKDQIGLRQVAFGSPDGKPEPQSLPTRLSVVQDAA